MFQAAVNYGAGASPYSVVVGDFNGDGVPDLVVANFGNPYSSQTISGSVSVLLGKGDGAFRSAVTYDAGRNPSSVRAADFNGDGKPDLAIANSVCSGGGPNVSVLLGKDGGTFEAAFNYVGVAEPSSVGVGDFNGDGKPDLAVADLGSGTVAMLLGNGDGTFQAGVGVAAGTRPEFLAVGDFNGDGKPDLVVGDDFSSHGIAHVCGHVCDLYGSVEGTIASDV